jgi:hypothetical protein
VKKILSPAQIECVSRQAGVGVPVSGAPVCFRARATRRKALLLTLCITCGFWINPETASADGLERATAFGSRSGAAPIEVRTTNGHGLGSGRAEDLSLRTAMFPGGGSGVIESAGVALFMCGLSRYLPRDSSQEAAVTHQCACVGEHHECEGADEPRRLAMHPEFLGWLFLCGFVSWGGTLWVERR